MKKIIIAISALVLSASAANAQSLLDLLKGSANQGVASSLLETIGNAVAGTIKTVDLAGTWNYAGAAAAISTENALTGIAANAAMGTVENKLNEVLAKVGIKPGSATLTFGSDYSFTLKTGLIPLNGTWTQTESGVTLKFGKALTYLTLDGTVKATTNGCEILFDGTKFLGFIEKVVTYAGKISKSTIVNTASTLLSSAKGLDLGLKLTK